MQYYRCEVCKEKGTYIIDDPRRGIMQELNPTVCESCWGIEQERVSRRVDKVVERSRDYLRNIIKQSDLKPGKRVVRLVSGED